MSAAVLSGVGIFANTAQANAAVQSSATNASQVRGVLTVVDHQKVKFTYMTETAIS